MGTSRKLLSLIVWCSIIFHKNVNSQGYYYKRSNVNAYHMINGKIHYIPQTTASPSLLETLFPWTGNAYDSVRTPEEDAAILNSLSDNEVAASSVTPTTNDDGILSWITNSIPLPSMSMPALPSVFGSSQPETAAESPLQPEQSIQFPSGMGPNPNPNPQQIPVQNNMNLYDAQLMGASSQPQPVIIPGPESQGSVQSPPPPQPQQPQTVPQYVLPNPNYIPQDLKNSVAPAFQFHQQLKDSIPIPNPSLPSFSQPMFPYPYSAQSNPDFIKPPTQEKNVSLLEMLSNYFQFGKRSDLEQILNQHKLLSARSSEDDDSESKTRADSDNETGSYTFDFEATREALDSKTEKDFLCPKSGIWRWNGEVCIAVGPVPVWACRPNDLIVSGKIAICRNKIYFSPKVINNHHD